MMEDSVVHQMVEIDSNVSIVVSLGTPKTNVRTSIDSPKTFPHVSSNRVGLVVVEEVVVLEVVDSVLTQWLRHLQSCPLWFLHAWPLLRLMEEVYPVMRLQPSNALFLSLIIRPWLPHRPSPTQVHLHPPCLPQLPLLSAPRSLI